jgi:hypothetical protein
MLIHHPEPPLVMEFCKLTELLSDFMIVIWLRLVVKKTGPINGGYPQSLSSAGGMLLLCIMNQFPILGR